MQPKFKILQGIIQWIAIPVMHYLVSGQRTIKSLLHYEPMLTDFSTCFPQIEYHTISAACEARPPAALCLRNSLTELRPVGVILPECLTCRRHTHLCLNRFRSPTQQLSRSANRNTCLHQSPAHTQACHTDFRCDALQAPAPFVLFSQPWNVISMLIHSAILSRAFMEA